MKYRNFFLSLICISIFTMICFLSTPIFIKEIGFLYYKGNIVAQNYNKAFIWIKRAACKDNEHSLALLGYMYATGKGTAKNIDKSIEVLSSLADKEDVSDYIIYAQKTLGVIYFTNHQALGSIDKAKKYLQKAFDNGDMEAKKILADIRIYQDQFENDAERIKEKAINGDLASLFLLGTHYMQGNKCGIPNCNIPKNNKKAAELFKKILKKEPDNIGVKILLANIYFPSAKRYTQYRKEALNYLNDIANHFLYAKDKSISFDSKQIFMYEDEANFYLKQALYRKGRLLFLEGKILRALKLFKKSALLGYSSAQNRLGDIYNLSVREIPASFYEKIILGQKKDLTAESFKWYSMAAQQEQAHSMVQVGIRYLYGIGVEQDIDKAHKLFQKVKNKNNKNALFDIGCALSTSKEHFTAQYDKAVEYFIDAAKKGYLESLLYASVLLLEKMNFSRNDMRMKKIERMAINLKYEDFFRRLGLIYLGSDRIKISCKINHEKAVLWFLESAKMGNPESAFNVGRMYLIGDGVEKNYIKAVNFIDQAYANGYKDAYSQISSYFYIRQKYKEAIPWLVKSANVGNTQDSFILGFLHCFGIGINKDIVQGLEFLDKAYANGYKNSFYEIGLLFGFLEDYSNSLRIFQYAIDKGHKEAMLIAGQMYLLGIGTQQDSRKGKILIENGYTDDDNIFSYENIAECLYYAQKYKNALYYYLKAGDGKKVNSLRKASFMYSKGIGVDKNQAKASLLYQKAIRLSNRKRLLSGLTNEFTSQSYSLKRFNTLFVYNIKKAWYLESYLKILEQYSLK